MKKLISFIAMILMSSCSELPIKRGPASEPTEIVVAETFNESQMTYGHQTPKGFHLSSCSLRSVRKNFKRTLPKKGIAAVFVYTNGKGETWTSPYHFIAYQRSDKSLIMLDEEGREVTSKYLTKKGSSIQNSYFKVGKTPEVREIYLNDPKEISSIKYYRSFNPSEIKGAQQKILSECHF